MNIATDIILSGMSDFGVTVKRKDLNFMFLLTSNTPGGIRIYIECPVTATPRQSTLNSHHAMFTEEGKCFDIFLVS
jgi:hypothetical protein